MNFNGLNLQADPIPWSARAHQSEANDVPNAKSSVERNMMMKPENIGIE